MSQQSVPGPVIDRLRANLRAAGIAAPEVDIQGMIEKGFLSRLATFEQIVERVPADRIPDYLAGWASMGMDEAGAVAPTGAGPPASGGGDAGHVPLYYRSIGAVGELIRTRQISPVELTGQLLERIAQYDAGLNAYQLVLDERARASAQRAEQAIAAGAYRGPLHGIPLAIKDLLDLACTPTTAGSRILAGRSAGADAAAVARLEAAGAVILGKTRLSEFAYSPGSNNAHYGATHNPWNPAHDSGGSSSGSAAAVAAGLAYAALGSDTGGSIRIPAALCGVVGLKPTFGRISLHGAVPLAWSLDHLGPLARSVADAALLLEVLAGADPRDQRTRGARPFSVVSVGTGVAGLRVGVLADDGSGAPLGSDVALAAWRSGLAALELQGANLIPIDLPELEALRWLNGAVLAMEASAYHLPWLRERLEDYGEFMRQRVLAAFAYAPGAFIRAQQARAVLRERCAALFERIDLLSTPSQPDVAPLLGTPASTTFTGPFNILGWPAISVPVGLTEAGLPLGLQLAGKPWDEATLLRAAQVVEAASEQLLPPLMR